MSASVTSPDGDTRSAIAEACRILAMEGLVDGVLGHISVRADDESMWIRCRGPHESGLMFTAADAIQRVTFDGRGAQPGYLVPQELSIHSELYRARPEVGCVIHAHPPAALVCGIAQLPIRPIFGAYNIPAMRMALEGIPVFPHSYLISRPELGQKMVQVMGDKNVCLLKGHGITVVGGSLEEAMMRALNLHILLVAVVEVAKTGRTAEAIPEEDIHELPDLGRGLNETMAYQYYRRKLAQWERRS
ncbi:MAG: class II aldolase/adducin family protein [Thermoflavifilum sp.]|nr:class II aldolase/adducin family protein [Thermoflavifilum sp.]MCL6513830.1 class II aldolase/adducin family protein [Alicyclobacillus sp.]